MAKNKGLFIVIEGLDGSGKSTQIKKISEFLDENNLKYFFTREPGGTSIGEDIRNIILDKKNVKMTPLTETFLYAASRSQHITEKIMPMLDAGYIVLCDRFVYSSIAYQGFGRGLGDIVRNINSFATKEVKPDLVIYLDIPSKLSKERVGKKELDRIELEKLDFYNRVREGYLKEAERIPESFLILDATKSVEEVSAEIIESIDSLIHRC